MYGAEKDACVYGERFTVELTDLRPGPYLALAVTLASGIAGWVYVPAGMPLDAEEVPLSCWRSRELTVGLAKLADEAIRSGRERAEVISIVRDQIRPLAQMNWVSIPWRTGANTSEWRWCVAYVDRLLFAAEIGL